jgi:hypothetical protein
MKTFFAMILAALVAACAVPVLDGLTLMDFRESAQLMRLRPIVIGDDWGGSVDDHTKFLDYLKQSGVPVRVEGMCVSACTLVALGLPRAQVCALPSAFLGFHLAQTGGRPNPELTEILISGGTRQRFRNGFDNGSLRMVH